MSIDNGAAKQKSSALWLWLAAAAVAIVVVLAVGILLIIPLIYPEQLPKDDMASLLIAPPPPPPPPPPRPSMSSSSPHPSGEIIPGLFGSQPPAHPKPAQPKRISISGGVMAGMLVQKTQPVYPPIAKAARVSGTVVLQATISRSGSVENLQVISGPAMLQQAAMDAVRQWRYKPYLLNGEPIEVITTVNVIFTLGG
jgi:protein TonB